MTAVTALAVVAAVCAWPVRLDPRRRLAGLRSARGRRPPEGRGRHPGLPVLAVVGVAGALAAGVSATVLLAGGVLAVGLAWRRRGGAAVEEDLALLVDLLAACLAAGVTTADAADAAGSAAGGPRGRSLLAIGARLRDGEPPATAWAAWSVDPELAPVARACARSAGSGAAVAAELRRAATRIRSTRAAATQRRVAAAGVWIVLPLGLCFLPAFVLVGVVPIAVGLLERVG
jgi:pilus assembly protein TadC